MNPLSSSLSIILLCSSHAFTFNPRKILSEKISFVSNVSALRMSSEDVDKVVIKSRLEQEISYDEDSGRFFESEQESCVEGDEYCILDKETGKYISLTIEEKERIFLDAIQSYYVNSRQMLSDDEFDLLKSDLQWAGSSLVNLNRKEAKFIAATQAYLKGDPVMSDEEFDALKEELKEDGSQFAVSKEPKCYIDTGVCKSTLEEDFFRTNLLYFPAGLILSLAWLGLGYEILGSFIKINPIVLLLLGSYFIYYGTITITDQFIFPNNKIAFGACPSCEASNRIYFGDILGVEGFSDVANVKCKFCKAEFRVQRNTLRASTLPPK